MKLLDEIVGILSDKNGSLTDALLKTKVLMHQIGHKELADWVNDETPFTQNTDTPGSGAACTAHGAGMRHPQTSPVAMWNHLWEKPVCLIRLLLLDYPAFGNA